MRKSPWLIGLKYLFYSLFLAGITATAALSQATVTSARHETLTQNQIDIVFNNNVTVNATPTLGWSVTANGNPVNIVNVTQNGPTGVRIQLDFTAPVMVPGHAGPPVQNYILTAETGNIRVNYVAAVGTLTSPAGEPNFVNQQSVNNFVFTCAELAFFQVGDYGTVDRCSPVVMNFRQFQYKLSLRYRNSTNYAGRVVQYAVAWGDGTPALGYIPVQSDLLGITNATFVDPAGFSGNPGIVLTIRPTKNYPANNYPTQPTAASGCTWDATLTPFVIGPTLNCNAIVSNTSFATYDTDATTAGGGGTVVLNPLTPTATSNMVCLGTNVNVRFTDATNLNCRAAIEVGSPNDLVRHIRIVYGHRDYDNPLEAGAVNNISDAWVTFPAIMGGTTLQITNDNATGSRLSAGGIFRTGAGGPGIPNLPDFNGVIELQAPVTVATAQTYMGTIFTTQVTNHKIGNRLYLQLQYWDICNPYNSASPTLPAPVTVDNFVEIITKPPVAVVTNKNFCYDEAMTVPGGTSQPAACANCYETSGMTGNVEVRWYTTLANANADASVINNDYGTNSRFLKPSEVATRNVQGGTGTIPNTGPNGGEIYSVWQRYRTNAVAPNNCLSDPVEVRITKRPRLDFSIITPTPATASASATTACRGDAITFSLPVMPVAPNAQLGFNTEYTWTLPTGWTISGATPNGDKTITATPGAGATSGVNTISVVWEYTTNTTDNDDCTSPAVTVNVTVLDDPAISASTGNRTICQDGSTTFEVTATGSGLVYTWQVDTDGGAPTFVNVPNLAGDAYTGQNTSVLTVNLAGLGLGTTFNGYQFRCIVSGDCEPIATAPISTVRTLTVTPKPAITVQPATGANICVNGTKVFSVTATGTATLTYQWQVDDGLGGGFVDVSGGVYTGGTTSSLSINTAGTGTTMDGYDYRVLVNSTGCPQLVTSSTVTLNIQGPTVAITNGATASVCAGNDLALTATESFLNGSFASRAWTGTYDENFAAAPALIVLNNAQLDALLTNGVGGSRRTALNPIFNSNGLGVNKVGTYVLTLTTTDNNGCPNTATITITVSQVGAAILYGNPPGPPLTADLNAQVCATFDLLLNGNPSGGSGTYSTHAWTKQSGPGVPGDIASLLNNPASRTPTFNTATTGTYVLRYAVQDNLGCTFATGAGTDITIVVNPLPAAVAQTPTVCSDAALGTTATVNLTANNASINPGPGVTIDWWTGYNAGTKTFTGAIATPTAAVVTNGVAVFARVRFNTTQCPSPASVTYTVNPRPAPAANPQNAFACNTPGTGVALNVDDPTAGFEVMWSTAGPNLASYTAVTGANGAISGTRNRTFTPTTSATATYYAFVRNTTTGCFSPTGTAVTQTQDLLPAASNAGTDQLLLCTTGATMAATAPNNSGVGTWTIVSGTATITSPNSPTSTITGMTQSAPGGAAVDVVLRWTVRSANNACTPSTDDVTLRVNALPAATNLTPQVCEDVFGGGAHANFDLTSLNNSVTGGAAGVTVEWFADPVPASPIIPATTLQTITNGAGASFFYRLTSPAGCQNTGTVTFNVRTLPAKADQTVQICENSPPGSLEATGINLQSYETAIANGSMVNRNIEWYEDAALTVLIPAGAALGAENNYRITADRQVFAKIIDTSIPSPQCFRSATLNLDYQPRPNNNQISDGIGQVLGATYTICASSNLVLLQLNPGTNPGSTIAWTVPPPSYPGEFELLSGTSGFFIILRFTNPIPGAGTLYPTGVPISVKETLGTALCDGNTINTRIVVEGSPPKPIISGPASVCSNANGVVFTVTNPVAGTYSWSLPAGATITSLPVTASSITVQMSTFSGNVSVTHASGTGCTSPASDPFPVSVINRPTITSTSTNSLCSGQNVSAVHSLTSNIASTTYNWEVISVVGSVTGSILGDLANGVTSINQTLSNTSGVTASVTYRVTPVGPAPDNCPGTPQNLTITVNPAPVITAGQVQVICSGSAANKEIILAPANLPTGTLFNWPDPDGPGPANAGVNIPMGAAGTFHITDVLTNLTNAPINVDYMVEPRSGSNCIGATVMVRITVNPQPVGFNDVGLVCSGIAAGYDLEANIANTGSGGNNLIAGNTYSWVANANAFVSGESTSAQSGKIITDVLRNFTTSNQTVRYTATPTSSASCIGASFTVDITVRPEPRGFDDASPVTCSDIALNYSLAANIANTGSGGNNLTTGTTYTWIATANPNVAGESTTGQTTAFITDVLTNVTNSSQVVAYTVTPVSVNGCAGAPFVVSVTVRPEPKGFDDPTPITCSDVTPNYNLQANILNTGLGGNGLITGTTYSWSAANNTNVGGESTSSQAGQFIIDVLTNETNADQVVVYTVIATSAQGCVGNPFLVSITVRPEPKGFNDATPAICSDAAVSYNLGLNVGNIGLGGNGLTAGTTYSWVAASNTNVGGESTTPQAGNVITDILNNITNADQVVVYTVTPTSSNLCVGNPFQVSVTVRPEPKGYDDNTPFVCSDVAVNYNLATNIANTGLGGNNLVTGTTYSWVAANNVNVTGESLTPQTGSLIADVLNNVTNSNQTVTYTVTPTSGASCVGNPFVVTITVRPEPRGFNDTPAAVCSNLPMTYDLAANIANTGAGGNNVVVGTTFSWSAADNVNTTGESTTLQSGSVINNTIRNVTNTNQTIVYTVIPTSADLCVGNSFTVTVVVQPEPRGFDDATPNICSDSPLLYNLVANIANTGAGGNNLTTGTTYSWVAANNADVSGESTSPQSGSVINDALNNVTTANQVVVYTVTPTSALGCIGGTFQVSVTVRPEPRGYNDATPVTCSDIALNYDLAANIANTGAGGNNLTGGTTYSWVAASNASVTGESTTPQTSAFINDNINNVTNANQTVVYTVTPTNGTCAGNTFIVTVTVRPEPRGFDDATPSICSDAAVNYNLANNISNVGSGGNNLVTGTTYSWVAAANGNVTGESTSPVSSAMITDVLNNVTTANEVVVYTVTPTSSDFCAGSPFQVSVTVRPEPRGHNDTTPVTCSDVALNIDLAANVADTGNGGNNLTLGTTYSWVAANNASVGGESTTPQAGAFITDVLNNVTTSNQTVVYAVTPSNGGCVGNVFSISVTVRPEPRGYNDATYSVCSDVAASYPLATNIANVGLGGNNLVAGTTYSWIAATNPNVSGESDVTPGTANTINDVLTNITGVNQTVNYTVTPTSALGCAGNTFVVSITVRPEPRGFNDPSPVICSDAASVNYDLATNIANTGAGGNGVTAGTTYSWIAATQANVTGESDVTPGTSQIINDVLNNITNVNQVVVYTVTPTSSGGCVGDPFLVSVTVRPEPKGFNDVAVTCSDIALAYDLSLNIANTVSGGNNLTTGTTYSWVAASNTNVTGESTSAQVGTIINDVLNNVTTSNQLVTYTVTPTSSLGCVGNTFTVTVTVRPEPRGFNDAPAAVCSGATLNYDLAANVANTGSGGNNLTTGTTYSWQAANNANITGESLTPQLGAFINDVLTNVTNANHTVVYTVTPTSALGCVGNSFTVSITVQPEPRGFDDIATTCSDVPSNYNLVTNIGNVGSGGNNLVIGTTYSWVAVDNTNVTGETIGVPGTTSTITDDLVNITNGNEIVVYTVTPTSANGCVGDPFLVSITVRPEPRGFNDATPLACSDVAFNYDLALNIGNTVSGGNNLVTGTTYSWAAASNPNVTGEGSGTTSVITDVINNVTNANQVVVYTVTPTSGNGCVGDPFQVSVTVRPEPRGFNDNSPIVCSDIAVNYVLSTNIANTVSGGNNLTVGTTYSWVAANNPNVSGESLAPVVATSITDVLTNITNANQSVVYTVTPTSANGCVGNDFIVTVTVRPEPRGFNDTSPLICSDANVNYNLAANVGNLGSGGNNLVLGTTFQWVAVDNANVTGETLAPVTSGTINDVLNNSTNGNELVVYNVIPTSVNGCVGDAFTVTVTVMPEPRGFNDPTPVICSDAAVAYDLSLNIANTGAGGNNLVVGTTYSWIAVSNANVGGESLSAQSGSIITDVLNNVTAADQIVVYNVTPTSLNSCVGNTFQVSVTVRPEPRGFNDPSRVICSDASVNYDLVANINNTGSGGNGLITGTTYSWIAADNPSVTGETIGVPGTTSNITDILTNLSGSNQVVVYTVTPTSANGCVGNTFLVSVTVRSEPVGALDNSEAVCSDVAINYNIQTRNINTLGNGVTSLFTYTVISSDPANVSAAGKNRVTPSAAAITDTYTNLTSADVLITYTITPFSNPGNCQGTDFDVVITIHPEPKAPANTPIARCSDVPVNFDLQTVVNTAVTGNSVLSFFRYTVASSNGAIVPAGPNRNSPSAAQITDVYTNLSNVDVDITYTVTPVSQADGCEGTPFTVVVTIHPEPVGTSIIDPVCSSALNHNIQTAHITNSVPSLFTYTVASSDPINVPPAADRVVATNAPITDTYTNSTGVDVTITYTITPQSTANGCVGTPFTYTVTISSKPVGADVTKASVCSDTPFSFDPQNDITNGVIATFTWSRPIPPGLTVRTAKVPQTGVIAETWTNTGNTIIDVVYTVTPTAGSCAGDPFVIRVPIRPEPVMLTTLDAVRCSDATYATVLGTTAASEPTANFNITAVLEAGGLIGTASTGNGVAANHIFNDAFTNQTAAQLRVTYTVIPNGVNGCAGDALDVILRVNPEPVLAPQGPLTICSDNTQNPSVTNMVFSTSGTSVGAGTYRLTVLEYRYLGDPAFSAALPVGFTIQAANADVNDISSHEIVKNDRFTNVSNRAVEVKYTIVPISPGPNSCPGDPLDYIVVVNPEPALDPALSPAPVCSGIGSNVTLAVDPGPPASIGAADYIIRSIAFPGLIAGPSNTGTGNGKPANAIFNDMYVNTTANPLNATYVIAPVSVLGGCVGLDANVVLQINPAPDLNVANAITCNDATANITLTTVSPPAAVAAANFNITNILVPGALTPNGSNATVQNGVASNFLFNDRFVNTTLTTQVVEYSVRPASAAGCLGPEEVIRLTVEPIIEVVPIPAAQTLCGDGVTTSNVQLTSGSVPSAGSISFNYTSTSTSAFVSGYSAIVNNLPDDSFIAENFVNSSNTVQSVTFHVTPRAPGARNGVGCSGTTVDFVITLEPKPRVTMPAAKTICENNSVAITLASPTVPSVPAGGTGALRFDLALPTASGNVTGFPGAPVTFNVNDIISDVLVNNDPTNSTVTYVVTPRFGTCVGDAVTTVVTVAPRPNITPIADFDICSGATFAAIPIQVDTDPSSTFVTWTATANAAVNGESNGAGAAFSQVLFNTHNNNGNSGAQDLQFVTYTIKARNVANVPACDGADETLVVGVYPVPRLTGLAPSINVCNGETRTVNLNSTATNTAFTWAPPDNGGNPDLPVIPGGGGNSIVQTFVNNGEFLGSYIYQITPTVTIPSNGSTCVGNDGVMIVNVGPQVTGTLTSNDGDNSTYVCLGSKDALNFAFGGMALFEYKYTDGTTTTTVTGKPGQDRINLTPTQTTTYTLTEVRDAFGCVANPVGQTVTVNVGVTNAAFSIVGPAVACSPFQVQFQHDQVAGVEYVWKWFDGVADSAYIATTSQPGQLIPHTFFNPSPVGTQSFQVFLESKLDDNYPGNCLKTTKQTVQVYPTVATAVFPDKDVICSDETVTFVNSSQGVSSSSAQHKWFYRVQGSTTELEVKTTRNVNFQLPNTTASNPIIYEIVYQATNGFCPAADVVTPITVYRGVDANFSYTPPTLFIGGHSTTTFTNTSAPVSTTDFRYEWEFGPDSNPGTGNGAGPFNLDYTTPGPKEIVLIATNMAAEAAGLSCFNEHREIMNISVPPLEIDFTAIPLQACFPTDVTITENMATGDKFAWRVLDNGGTAASSNAVLPVFKIPAPGRYTIELTTSNSFTGDQKTLTKDVIIYDLPMASFDIRPAVVYVPDGVVETYNFSDGATEYEWDFGDGTIELTKEPTHNYRIEGQYDIMLIAKNNHGPDGNGVDVVCVDTLVRKVTAKQGGVTRVPNAFTPNPNGRGPGEPGLPGDNTFNDVFLPQVRGAEEFNMQIFDRWGNLIFESNSAKIGWDGYDRNGRLLPAGVYVFKLTLRLSDGQRTTQIGDITMIR